jgi:serine/threonine protein kinase/WD40 repeat protein/tetratricopeptide (TPR) repeat protein
MTADAPERDPLEEAADSFLARLRAGERPSLSEYEAQHPELAADIRDLFPALVMMEQGRRCIDERGDPPAADPARLSTADIPEQLGEYRLLREIGRGGMGVVYEARQESLGRHVALKVLPFNRLARAEHLERFRREARAAARLHHTNIVPVYGVGEHEGIHYYAMQFIHGQGLDSVLDEVRRLRGLGPDGHTGPALATTVARSMVEGKYTDSASVAAADAEGSSSAVEFLPPNPRQVKALPTGRDDLRLSGSSLHLRPDCEYFASVARIVAQAAEALGYAHSQGVVHRDVKPSNLLLDTAGRVWITDFGLAKAEDSEELTQTGDILGTVRYMAPERFQGQADERSDVYGLGVTLYEMLTLRPAFEPAPRGTLVEQISRQEPPRPRKLDARIPRDLETIVLKAMAKEPGRRYARAGDLVEDLHRFLADRPIRARQVRTPERVWRWSRRNPALAGLIGSVITGLLAIAILASLSSVWLKGERQNLARQFEQTDKQRVRAEEAEQQGRLELGNSLLAQGKANERTGLAGQRFDSLELFGRAAAYLRSHPQGEKYLPEVRDQAIAALGLSDLRVHWQRRIGVVLSISSDARLERYAVFGFGSGDLVVRGMDNDRELLRMTPPGVPFWYAHAVFSPDGRYLAAVYKTRGEEESLLRVWRLGRNEPIFSEAVRGGWAFHPDGRRLLFSPLGGGLGIWDLEAGREVKRLPLDLKPYDVCVANDGRRVAVNADDSQNPLVKILDLDTGRELASWNSQVGSAAMAWSADDRLLAIGSKDGPVFVWDVRRGQLASVLQGHANKVIWCYFAHEGHLLATYAWGGTSRLWDAASGEALATVTGRVDGPFSPDDRWLPFQHDDKIGVWEVPHGRECRTLHPGMVGNRTDEPGDGTAVYGADISPDGRVLAAACGDGVRLYDTASGRELAHLPVGACGTVLFEPNGQSLITYCRAGLYRWPIRFDDQAPLSVSPQPRGEIQKGVWRVGPPQLLGRGMSARIFGYCKAAWMPSCKGLVVADNDNARVVLIDLTRSRLATSRAAALPSKHHKMTSIAVSPDGRWAAAGGWNDGVQVWNVPERRLERVLPASAGFTVSFSPDGRWLVSHSQHAEAGGYSFWQVGSWKRGLVLPNSDPRSLTSAVFSRDGRLMALGLSPQQILLADAATGRAIAHLSTLQPLSPGPLAFSADGTRLVASTNKRTLLLWDLRAVRAQLAARDLDWDQPPYPPPAANEHEKPCEVQVDPGDLLDREKYSLIVTWFPFHAEAYYQRGLAYARYDQLEQARADFTMTLTLRPDHAGACFQRGLIAARQHRPADARADFTRAIDLEPQRALAYRERGRAHLNLQHWDEAVSDLSRSLEIGPRDPVAWRLRAFAYARLQKWDQALADLTQAIDLDGDYIPARIDRAYAYVREGRWDQVAADFARLAELDPNNHLCWYQFAALRLYLGDRQDYRRICQQMLARFGNTDNRNIAERTAKTCALAPDSGIDPGLIVKLADRAVSGAEKHPDYRWFAVAKALAEYRSGHAAAAVKWLKRCSPQIDGTHRDATAFAILAMANYRLASGGGANTGRLAKEARAALRHAEAILAQKMPDPKAGRPFGANFPFSVGQFPDWLRAQILCREAEALLGTPDEKPGHKDSGHVRGKP